MNPSLGRQGRHSPAQGVSRLHRHITAKLGDSRGKETAQKVSKSKGPESRVAPDLKPAKEKKTRKSNSNFKVCEGELFLTHASIWY